MMRSMTAFGRGVGECGGGACSVEIRSVNNRFFDCSIRLPRALSFLEDRVRERLGRRGISRGKIDLTLTLDGGSGDGTQLVLDETLASQYVAALKQLRDAFRLTDDISVMGVAQNRDLFRMEKPAQDEDALWEAILPILDSAIDAFLAAREREGDNLRTDLRGKLAQARETAARIAAKSEENTVSYRTKLEGRLRQTLEGLDVQIDAQRILTECAIFADRIAVDEELVRLESHFTAFEAAMDADEPVGRRMDFLLQEMNREINTTGSKSSDAEIAQWVVDLKCLLEKIREQIQNIE